MSAASKLDCAGSSARCRSSGQLMTMKTIEMGQVLELLATDPGVEPDIQAWTRRTGNELVSIEERDGIFHVFLRRAR